MRAAALQIGHVNVAGFKAGQREGVSHLHMRVHALLTQDGYARAKQGQCGGSVKSSGLGEGLGQPHVQAGVLRIADARMLGVSALRVVALLADFPAHSVPHLMQVLQ